MGEKRYLFDLGLGEEIRGFGAECGEGGGEVVVGEVSVDDKGDLDGGDPPVAEILRLPVFAAAVLGHRWLSADVTGDEPITRDRVVYMWEQWVKRGGKE